MSIYFGGTTDEELIDELQSRGFEAKFADIIAEMDKEIARLEAGWREANFSTLEKAEELRASNESLVAAEAMVTLIKRTVLHEFNSYAVPIPSRIAKMLGRKDNLTALAEHDAKHEKEIINKLAAWMTERGIGTGHGDTIDGLLSELDANFKEVMAKALEDAAKKCISGNWAELMLLEMAAELRAEG